MAMSSKLVIGFGASTMQGARDPQGGFFKRMAEADDAGREYVNLGIGGNTTRTMLARAANVRERAAGADYDLVVVLGCNDMPRDRDGNPDTRTSLEEYSTNLARLLAEIRGTRSLFVSSFPVDPARCGVQPETFALYMGAALEIAQAAGYEIWDLYHEVMPVVEPYWDADGVHFNDAGHAFLAREISARLKGSE
jgi:lysophospholipase L1-like esterase